MIIMVINYPLRLEIFSLSNQLYQVDIYVFMSSHVQNIFCYGLIKILQIFACDCDKNINESTNVFSNDILNDKLCVI